MKTGLSFEKIAQVRWSFWAGVAFFFWVLIGFVWVLDFLMAWLDDANTNQVSSIAVEGNHRYVYKQDIITALEPQLEKSMFAINVDDAAARLSALEWVYQVSVYKQWPNGLRVDMVEQEPAAHWNEDFLLNKYGDVFNADMSRLTLDLVWIYGPEGDEKRALETYISLSQLMDLYQIEIKTMTLSERHSLQLILGNGIRLLLGREDWLNRVKRYVTYSLQLQEQQSLAYVDLRYDTGFAVGFKPAENELKTESK